MAKERKPTAAEAKIELAQSWLGGVYTPTFAYEGQAEICYTLQQKFRLTRQQIANVTDLSFRQVQTRLKQYRKFVLTGEIPSAEVKDAKLNTDVYPIEDVIDAEAERREGSDATKQAKVLVDNELLTDKIIQRIAPLLPTKQDLSHIDKLYREFKPKTIARGGEEVAVATMSDLHLCLKTRNHDYERGLLANDNFMRKVISLTNLHRTQTNVRTVHLNALGDLIQGTANYPAQKWDVDRPAVDQAEALVEVMVRNIELLLLNFENVVVNWANGNHEYIVGKKQTTDPEHSSWGQVAVRCLMWAFRHNKRVTFNVPESWYQVVNIAGYRFLLTHGHAMPGSGSFDGVVTNARKWADTLPEHDYLVLGHFHRLSKLPLPKPYGSALQRYVYMNGTAVGDDTFIEKMGGSPVTQWWLHFVKEGRGITAEYAVDLYS